MAILAPEASGAGCPRHSIVSATLRAPTGCDEAQMSSGAGAPRATRHSGLATRYGMTVDHRTVGRGRIPPAGGGNLAQPRFEPTFSLRCLAAETTGTWRRS